MLKLQSKNIIHYTLICFFFISCSIKSADTDLETNEFGLPRKPYKFSPNTYALKTFSTPPIIDGKNTNNEWDQISWSSGFVSEIDGKNHNNLDTKFKMGFYNDTIYLFAKINDSQIWAIQADMESKYFKDNFFEIYIDCDNNEYDYLNININALGVIKGNFCKHIESSKNNSHIKFQDIPVHAATSIYGTINNPNDTDKHWLAELSFPLNIKEDSSDDFSINRYVKMNFALSKWQYVLVDGTYKKMINSNTGTLYNKDQWLWSYMWENPVDNIELWGEVYLLDNQPDQDKLTQERRIKWELRNVFYAQQLHHKKYKKYANKIAGLKDVGFDLSSLIYRPDIKANKKHFIASITDKKDRKIWNIDDKGIINWEEAKK